ncbi:hypothetical protein PSENEW3n2_00000849 [Picochlorum sp. SENEW3]|nr:hypothetical protein PSENEW3n2_00000849 [Picochlorum sp. SENEW3]WPT15771.1 hypothetical protein PSENEW3_00000849 [Picochlorum sp. SENEW3]
MPSLGCDQRLIQVVRLLQSLGSSVDLLHEITKIPEDSYLHEFRQHFTVKRFNFTSLCNREGYNVVLSQTWFWNAGFMPIISKYIPYDAALLVTPKTILLHDDAHFARNLDLRKSPTASEREISLMQEEGKLIKARMKVLYAYATVNVFLTDEDLRDESAHFTIRTPKVMPIGLPSRNCSWSRSMSFHERNGFIFVGNGHVSTNYYSLDWLLLRIWPLVQKSLPSASLKIIGNEPWGNPLCKGSNPIAHCWQEWKQIVSNLSNVKFLGFVQDLAVEINQSKVLIAPIRYGTGVNTKTLLAAKHCIPCISTSKASRSMPDLGLSIADNEEEFARKMVALHQDSHEWSQKREELTDDMYMFVRKTRENENSGLLREIVASIA